jgi:hypothetical protein
MKVRLIVDHGATTTYPWFRIEKSAGTGWSLVDSGCEVDMRKKFIAIRKAGTVDLTEVIDVIELSCEL